MTLILLSGVVLGITFVLSAIMDRDQGAINQLYSEYITYPSVPCTQEPVPCTVHNNKYSTYRTYPFIWIRIQLNFRSDLESVNLRKSFFPCEK